MDEFAQKMDDFLTNVFNSILKYEEDIIKRNSSIDISINELHLIDAVGRCPAGNNTVSTLATMLGITNSSVTIAVNKLVQRGYLSKSRGSRDGRTVYVYLTEQGTPVYQYHRDFHQKMAESVSNNLNQEEKLALSSGIEKLRLYFEDIKQRKSTTE